MSSNVTHFTSDSSKKFLVYQVGAEPRRYFDTNGQLVANHRDPNLWMDEQRATQILDGWGSAYGVERMHVLPAGLAHLEQFDTFILFKLVPSTRVGKLDKLPCNIAGVVVSAHDPKHWVNYKTASAAAVALGDGYGVGFVFSQQTSVAVVDVDGCIDPSGKLSDTALSILALFPGSYVEVSASGTGLHIWFTYAGIMPPHCCKKEELGLEFYHELRFFALGKPYEAEGFVNGNVAVDQTGMLQALVVMYFPPDAKGSASKSDWSEGHELGWELPNDEELIRIALKINTAHAAFVEDGVSFADLWTRNVSKLSKRYHSDTADFGESEADLALASKLAWLTGNDCPRIEHLMRQSALARGKWDSHKTYLSEFTIPKALVQDGHFWDPKYGEKQRQEAIVKAVAAIETTEVAAGEIDLKGVEASLMMLKSHDSVAQVFEMKFAGKLLYNNTRKLWMMWDGTRWKYDGTNRAFDWVRNLTRALNFGGASTPMGQAQFSSGVEKFARASNTFSVTIERFDLDNYQLNTPAGTVDLQTGNTRAHCQSDYITKCTGASPDTVGDGPNFRKFMMDITAGDQELIEFHQVSLGSCLSGAVEEHWLQDYIGTGRNGKNTLIDLVMDAMGDYAIKFPASALMSKSNESHPTEIAVLQGVRLAVSSEINNGDYWNEARIKELSGDATLTGRFMRQDFFEFPRTHKHTILGNSRPRLRSVGEAIKSRFKIVPFPVSFLGREDPDLPQRLRGEIGYVLQWMIEGHRKWLAAGKKLPKCAAVEAESADYFASQSTVEMWLDECCKIVPVDDRPLTKWPMSSDAFRSYHSWKKDRGEIPMSLTVWGQEDAIRKLETGRSPLGKHIKGLEILPRIGPPVWGP